MAIFYPTAEGPRSPTCLTALSSAHVIGEAPPRGTAAGYWGHLLALWTESRPHSRGARRLAAVGAVGFRTTLKPVHKGGPGPEVFIPWRNVLRLSGEHAPDEDLMMTYA